MRNKWISHGLKAALVLITGGSILLGTAFSSWNNLKSVQGDSNSIGDSSLVAVCYITNTNGTTYYTDLTRALYVANTNNLADQIYVIPSLKNSSYVSSGYNFTEVTISENRTINAQDTLNLPFSGETTFEQIDGASRFSDNNASNMKTYWTTDVVIESNVTLTVNGTINVGAQMFVKGGGKIQGQTSGYYTQMSLASNASIVVNSGGTLNLYGYIKEYNEGNSSNALVNVKSGGTINTPFVFYDFKGGGETLKLYSAGAGVDSLISAGDYILFNDPSDPGVFPISIFDLPNIQVKLRINQGATWTSFSDFYAFDQHNNINGLVLSSSSSNSIFYISGGSSEYFTCDYTPTTTVTLSSTRKVAATVDDAPGVAKLSVTNPAKTYWDFHCNATFNNITLTDAINYIATLDVSTEGKFLPFSYKFDITFSSGTITSAANIKFLYGCKVHVKPGAGLIANSAVIAYDSTMTVNGTASTAWSDLTSIYAYPSVSNLGDALLINDGTVTVNSSFGGRIRTTVSDGSAKIVFGTNASYSTTSIEYSGEAKEWSVRGHTISFGYSMDVINSAKATLDGSVVTLNSATGRTYSSSTKVDSLLSDDTTTYYEWTPPMSMSASVERKIDTSKTYWKTAWYSFGLPAEGATYATYTIDVSIAYATNYSVTYSVTSGEDSSRVHLSTSTYNTGGSSSLSGSITNGQLVIYVYYDRSNGSNSTVISINVNAVNNDKTEETASYSYSDTICGASEYVSKS